MLGVEVQQYVKVCLDLARCRAVLDVCSWALAFSISRKVIQEEHNYREATGTLCTVIWDSRTIQFFGYGSETVLWNA